MSRGITSATRLKLAVGLVLLLSLTTYSSAFAANGNQALVGTVATALTATFPSDYSWGALTIATTNTSTEQSMTIKSNKTWGVKINSDQSAGKMREWDGSAYVSGGAQLANATQWAKTSPTPVGSYTDLSSTQALVIGSQAKTDNSGTTVGVTYKQTVGYSDTPTSGSNVYRIVVTYDAAQDY